MTEQTPIYTICELFASLQGEATWTGRPMVFVRFSGCPLQCDWCDEPLHRQEAAQRSLSLPALLEEVRNVAAGTPSVLLTGGEPLLQPHLNALIAALKGEGYWVAMETCGVGGVLPVGLDWLTLSPKTTLAEAWFRSANEIKFVVSPPPAKRQLELIRHWMAIHDRVWVQPVAKNGHMDKQAAQLCCRLVMESQGQLRLSVQTHRWLGIR